MAGAAFQQDAFQSDAFQESPVVVLEATTPTALIERPQAIDGSFDVAFQQTAFQNNVFQMSPVTPSAMTYPARVTIIQIAP